MYSPDQQPKLGPLQRLRTYLENSFATDSCSPAFDYAFPEEPQRRKGPVDKFFFRLRHGPNVSPDNHLVDAYFPNLPPRIKTVTHVETSSKIIISPKDLPTYQQAALETDFTVKKVASPGEIFTFPSPDGRTTFLTRSLNEGEIGVIFSSNNPDTNNQVFTDRVASIQKTQPEQPLQS